MKGYDKREWVQNVLQDDAREDVYIENIDAHYEDIEFLNKLDVTHTLRCQKYVTNCSSEYIQTVLLVAPTLKIKHQSSKINICYLRVNFISYSFFPHYA